MRTIKSKEVEKIIKEHQTWILSNGKRGTRAYFIDVDLRNACIRDVNLSGACFRGANLSGMDLSSVNLRSYMYDCSDELGLSFIFMGYEDQIKYLNKYYYSYSEEDRFHEGLCWYHRTDFREANLSYIKAPRFLKGVNFREANLSGAILNKCCLNDAILDDAELQDSSLIESSFTETQMQGANFLRAKLRRASFYLSVASRAIFDNTDLREAKLRKSLFDRAYFTNANLNHAELIDSSFIGTYFDKSSLIKANMSLSSFHQALFVSAKLDGAIIRQARLINARLDESSFKGVDLRESDLSYAQASGVKFNGADFTGVVITDWKILSETSLENVSCHYVYDYNGRVPANRNFEVLEFTQMHQPKEDNNQYKYYLPNVQDLKVFENINTYIENNNVANANPGYEQALNDLKEIVANLERKYPKANEEQASMIIEAEFWEIQTTQPERWENFLDLKRIWNGVKKGSIKAGEHFTENTVWGKALIGFLEGFTDDIQ
jgi:uncharacterized protein YjbI with pentapeptide repeats